MTSYVTIAFDGSVGWVRMLTVPWSNAFDWCLLAWTGWATAGRVIDGFGVGAILSTRVPSDEPSQKVQVALIIHNGATFTREKVIVTDIVLGVRHMCLFPIRGVARTLRALCCAYRPFVQSAMSFGTSYATTTHRLRLRHPPFQTRVWCTQDYSSSPCCPARTMTYR